MHKIKRQVSCSHDLRSRPHPPHGGSTPNRRKAAGAMAGKGLFPATTAVAEPAGSTRRHPFRRHHQQAQGDINAAGKGA
ncbi:hypothetical protein Misp04_06470 [Micromonospora sp. NBRC 101691]|nr:hypothetical protein Misp04_06470 [Micromonospora sp. NBRC 101691]